MTQFELVLAPFALQRLEIQYEYFLQRSGNPLSERWLSSTNDVIRSLRAFPWRGSPCHFELPSLNDLRRLAIPGFPKHFIIYRCDEDKAVLTIVSIVHASQDIETELLAYRQSTLP